MKLPAFPVPVAGETVQSAVARFMRRTAGPAGRKLAQLALSNKATAALLPRHVEALTSVMPLGHPWCDAADVIVNLHSLVPLYLHFTDRSYATDIQARLASGGSGNPNSLLGLTVAVGNAPRGTHKFCPACVDEDRATRGFAVGYRHHQPTFVRVCADHRVALSHGCSQCHSSRTVARRWTVVGECGCLTPQSDAAVGPGESDLSSGWHWLSAQVRAILAANSGPQTSLLPVLRDALLVSGLLGESGAGKRIHDALSDRFGQDLLRQVGAVSERHSEVVNWPLRLLGAENSTRAYVPSLVRALLLAGLVADDVTA